MTPFVGELIGTMILIVFGAGVVGGVVLKQSKAENAGWIVITIGWGLAVTMGVYAVGNISGAHLNPAVTIGFAVIGEFPWADVPSFILAQVIGAILGAAIIYFQYLPHWGKTDSPQDKLGVFATIPAIRHPLSNITSEIIGTFILLLGLLMIGANDFTEGLNPVIVGALIVAIGMSLGGPTGYAINPARDLGPRIAHFILPIPGKGSSDWKYALIPIIGPILGGTFGALFYQKFFEGENSVAFWIVGGICLAVLLAAQITIKKDEANSKSKNIKIA